MYEGMEERFLDALDFWDRMDQMLRGVYSFEGCVMGPGQRCPDESPVSCRGCGVPGGQVDTTRNPEGE